MIANKEEGMNWHILEVELTEFANGCKRKVGIKDDV